jgi:predicted double-glycine peptidase
MIRRLTETQLIELVSLIIEEVNETPTKILDVPHFLQSDDSTCGPASLRMVFGYYGTMLSEKDIAEICDHTYELGCKSEDMACAAESLGFKVYMKNNSTIEEVVRLIDANVPVIVDWFCGDPPEGHSSVVIGYNDENLFILDPYLEEMRVVSKYDFRRCWFDFYETPITPQNLYVGQIIVIRPGNKNMMEQTEDETITKSERKKLDFFDLVDKGIVFVTEPFGDGKKQKANWEGDSNIITLWNLNHPEEGQEWVFDAIKYPKPEAVQWWNDKGQFTLKDAKYNQILRSIDMFNGSNKKEQTEGELQEKCWKGYTQKGMKTMFGKRYPNCVKKKK